jgi:hypothetical protein
MTDDRSSDVSSEADRATVRRLIDEINEFNVEASGIRDFRELLAVETDSHGELVAGVYGWSLGGLAGSMRSGCARTCAGGVSAAGCCKRLRRIHERADVCSAGSQIF